MDETTRVLVGYATAAGSTAGIAERIADVLRDRGFEVVCRPVGPDLDPTAFEAWILGSAVHSMAWLPPAVDFLRRVPTAEDLPMWCFSVGGVAPRGPVTRWMTEREVRRVAEGFPATFHARDHRLFGGVVQMNETPLWGRILWRLIGGRPGDHRDWPAIEAWAGSIADELSRRRARAS